MITAQAAVGRGTPNTTVNSVSTAGSTTYRCLKCARLIVIRTRQCVDTCPSGYSEEWSDMVDYMGRICKGECSIFFLKFNIVLRVYCL